MSMRLATALLLATTAAAPVAAQSLPGNSNLSGFIELEHLSGDGFSDNVIAADVTLKIRPDAMSGFGFDLGVQGAQTDDEGMSAIYATAVLSLGGGELSFGIPRSAMREIFGSKPFAGAQYLDLQISMISQVDYLTPLYVMSDVNMYGLRYDNTFGAARISTGLYKVEDATVTQVAMEYDMQPAKLQFGVEHLSGSGDSITTLALGASASFGAMDVSGLLRHLDVPGGSANSLRLDGAYNIGDAFKVGASYLTASDGFDDILGLSAEYTFTKSAYVQAGVLNAAGDNVYDLSLGVKF